MADMLKRVPVREQEAKVRATNFEEVCYGYNQDSGRILRDICAFFLTQRFLQRACTGTPDVYYGVNEDDVYRMCSAFHYTYGIPDEQKNAQQKLL